MTSIIYWHALPRGKFTAQAPPRTAGQTPTWSFYAVPPPENFFARYGLEGFNAPDRLPENGEKLFFNNVSYHKRAGAHYFGREDWLYYMEYAKKYL